MITKPINFELLRDAYAIIDGIPDDAIHLNYIVSRRGETPACGTIACTLGFLAMHPQFQALGLGLKHTLGMQLTMHGHVTSFRSAAHEIFGLNEAETEAVFGSYGVGAYDPDLVGGFVQSHDGKKPSHKQLFKLRVVEFLREHGQPVAANLTL